MQPLQIQSDAETKRILWRYTIRSGLIATDALDIVRLPKGSSQRAIPAATDRLNQLRRRKLVS